MTTPSDISLLFTGRALRGFGDGFAIIILPVYLSAIGFSPQLIGIVASASLLGTAALTLIVGFIAPRFELRSLFLAGAGLIALTGLIFPAAETIASLKAPQRDLIDRLSVTSASCQLAPASQDR